MPILAIPTILLLLGSPLPTQDPEAVQPPATETPIVPVFRSGEAGYQTFRIPAIVRAADGALVAFAEGRRHGANDSGDIDIVLKRSADLGRNWSKLQVIADHGAGVAGNPCPVVDRTSGDLVLLFVRQPAGCHEGDIRADRKGYRDPFVMRSDDHGKSWSEPTALPGCDREEWRWYATGPCHAIQLQHGPHKGRIVAPANHSVVGSGANDHLGAHLLLSDDGGKTFVFGAIADSQTGNDIINPSETTIAELENGDLYINTRDQHGKSPGTRAVATSADQGQTLMESLVDEEALKGPVCQGSVLAITMPGGSAALLFSGPSADNRRERLAIRHSIDGGKSWQEHQVLYQGSAAYSDMVGLEEDQIGCLFEIDGYSAIVFTTFDAPSGK